jgi:hypothetical protein
MVIMKWHVQYFLDEDLELNILKLFGAGDSAHVKRRLQDNQ